MELSSVAENIALYDVSYSRCIWWKQHDMISQSGILKTLSFSSYVPAGAQTKGWVKCANWVCFVVVECECVPRGGQSVQAFKRVLPIWGSSCDSVSVTHKSCRWSFALSLYQIYPHVVLASKDILLCSHEQKWDMSKTTIFLYINI